MRLLPVIALLLTGMGPCFSAERLDEVLALPPVLKRFYGEAVIHATEGRGGERPVKVTGAGSYHPRKGIRSPRRQPEVAVRGRERFGRETVAAGILRHFHRKALRLEARSRQEQRLELAEFLPVDESVFVEKGTRRMLKGTSGSDWFDAWWTIRMGLPQRHDPDHHLGIVLLKMDYDGKRGGTGHFCFALRRKGGHPDRDVLFDFRAPWYLDRQPTLLEGMNYGNRLVLKAESHNLYDWIFTQTSHRHCDVDIWFLPVTEEQVAVLRYFQEGIGELSAGQFKGLRKNCASLGLAYLDRLRPISEPISPGKGLADIPTQTIKTILKSGGEKVPHFRLENNTDESGRETTAKSKVHPAQPGRVKSRSFRALQKVAGIN